MIIYISSTINQCTKLCYVTSYFSTFSASNGHISVIEDGEEKKLLVSLSDVLVFVTGAADVPPVEFEENPSIMFKSAVEATSDLPSASTCSNTLYLPMVHCNDYDTFKYKFVFALTCAIGFGQV